MNLVFGKVPQEFINEEDYFETMDGTAYYYSVYDNEMEEAVIADTVGRIMPISVEHIPDLIKALKSFYTAATLMEAINSNIPEAV
jgi:50S ribosomal subunit-associated GTPase HflX